MYSYIDYIFIFISMMLNTFTKGQKKQNERSDFRKRSKNIIAKLYTQNIIITREKILEKISGHIPGRKYHRSH